VKIQADDRVHQLGSREKRHQCSPFRVELGSPNVSLAVKM
jgi:hypothetical protein